MSRLLQLIPAGVVAVVLASMGFYLTGTVASQLDPQALEISATAAIVFIAIAAWGLPAGIAWLAAGILLRKGPLGLALLCAASEVLVLALSGLLEPFEHTHLVELRALTIALLWPAVFITLFSVAGALLGVRVRQAFVLPSSGFTL